MKTSRTSILRCLATLRRDRGSAVVEFALIAPAFFLIVSAVLVFGRAYQRLNIVTGALRDGARYASTLATPCSSTAAIRTRIANYATAFGMTLNTADVWIGGTVYVGANPPPGGCHTAITTDAMVGIRNYELFGDLNFFSIGSQTVTRYAIYRWERAP